MVGLAGDGGGTVTRHSKRRASVGFTVDARRAGMRAAPRVATQRIRVAAAIVAGSVGVTPYNCD